MAFVEQSRYRGTTRVRVMEQVCVGGHWKRQLVAHTGTAHDDLKRAVLMDRARELANTRQHPGQLALDLSLGSPLPTKLRMVGEYWYGAEKVLGVLFDEIPLPLRPRDLLLLRSLVIARIMAPASKRRTAAWLARGLNSSYSEDDIYRFMDRLHAMSTKVTTWMQDYIRRRFPDTLTYLLYDVTSVYWESDDEDTDMENAPGLRKRDFSKDHREDLPQVVVGLAVTTQGMPVDCRLYQGAMPEGKTLLDGVRAARDAMGVAHVTVVADAEMLSDANLKALKKDEFTYIVGARLKSLAHATQAQVVEHDYTSEPSWEFLQNGRRHIVTYSHKRARKAQWGRERSVARLENLLAHNKAVRKHRFLDIPLAGAPRLNPDAIAQAARWDGIKGYVTNTEMTSDEVISRYTELYRVEQTFRMSKSDLRVRPAFHRRDERIRAHFLLCMVALCVMRVFETLLRPVDITPGDGIHTL